MEFKVFQFNKTPLMAAIHGGHLEIFNLLLNQKNIDINCKDI